MPESPDLPSDNSPPFSKGLEPPQHLVDTLVGQALDDLDAGRISLREALEMLCKLAWSAGAERRG
jgi:hypothetical protein